MLQSKLLTTLLVSQLNCFSTAPLITKLLEKAVGICCVEGSPISDKYQTKDLLTFRRAETTYKPFGFIREVEAL